MLYVCNRNKLTEAALWVYARDLFSQKGFGETVDFGHITPHCYGTHPMINLTGIASS